MQLFTIPLDTSKVRLQLQKKAVAGDGVALPKYRGMLGTVGTIAREEGLSALWKGIVPGLHRQCLFGGLRIGMYEPVCFTIFTPFWIKLLMFVGLEESLNFVHYLCAKQVKDFYVGDNFVGDVPLSKKVLAALTTGENI